MGITNATIACNNTDKRHAAPLEDLDLLLVAVRDLMPRIRQAEEGKLLVSPVSLEAPPVIGANGHDLDIPRAKRLVIIAEAPQLGAAVGSQKAPQEGQHHDLLSAKVREPDEAAMDIAELEIRGELAGSDQARRHPRSRRCLTCVQMSSNILTVNLPVDVFCWLGW